MASKTKKTMQYAAEDLKKALDAIDGGMPILKASKIFNIPRTTLTYKHKGIYPKQCRKGPPTNLTPGEEKSLVKWLDHIGDCGFPATKTQLLDSVEMLMKEFNRPNNFINNRPGNKWYSCFMNRHPELSVRMSQNISEANIRNWFGEIENYLKNNNFYHILNDSKRVFNADETAFFFNPKIKKVIVKRGESAVYNFINNNEKECLTTLITANAAGQLAPPMVIFPYIRIPSHIISSMPSEWGVGRSSSGWMTGQSFYEYITNVFYRWLLKQNIPLPIILFVDGHVSYLTLSLSEFCTEKGIVIIALYPNSTHILQPMDVSVFHPLKSGWRESVHKWKFEHDGQPIKRENFAPMLHEVLLKYIKPETIANGFRACGIVPFDPSNINFKKFFKSVETINSDLPSSKKTSKKDLTPNLRQQLIFLESKIEVETLIQFKSCGGVWSGRTEDTSLFDIWYNISSEINLLESTTQHSHNPDNSSAMSSNDSSSLDNTINNNGTDYFYLDKILAIAFIDFKYVFI